MSKQFDPLSAPAAGGDDTLALDAYAERAYLEALRKLHASTAGEGLGINCADGPFGPLTVIGGRIYMEDGRIFQTMDSRFPTCTNGKKMTEQIRAALGDGAELRDVTAAEPFYIEADSPAILACINTYNEVTGENAKPFTMGGGTYARHFPYAVSFGPEHVDLPLPEFGGPMHGANEAAPIDKLLEACASIGPCRVWRNFSMDQRSSREALFSRV